MKKIIVAILVLILLLTLFGCGREETTTDIEDPEAVELYEEDGEEAESSDISDDSASEDSSDDAGILSPEFKKTMDDYEAWFDHYCEVMKKYQDNPTDLELMSEMTDLLTEETTMLEQMENMDQSEMNTAELAYYIEVTARIEKKLLEVIDD